MYPRNCFSCDGRRNSGSNGNTGPTGPTGPIGITASAVYSIFLITDI